MKEAKDPDVLRPKRQNESKKRSSSVPTATPHHKPEESTRFLDSEFARSDRRIKGLALSITDRLDKEGPGYLEKLRLFYSLRNAANLPPAPPPFRFTPPATKVVRTCVAEKDVTGGARENGEMGRDVALENEDVGPKTMVGPNGTVFYCGQPPDVSEGELSDRDVSRLPNFAVSIMIEELSSKIKLL